MIRIVLHIVTVAVLLVIPALAQDGIQVNFDVTGGVRSTDGFSMPYARVVFDRNGTKSDVRTDINGEFKTTLFHGNYLITVDGGSRSTHLQVGRGMPEGPVNLIVDASNLRDETLDYPVVEKSELPAFPPAAVAVRAEGVVKVEARIAKEGTVIEAKAIEGHPLLRAGSVQAARKWAFSAGDTDRTVIVRFVFMQWADRKEGSLLQPDPYRHFIVAPKPNISN